MAKSYEVLAMLIPNGGYSQSGEDYEGITFLECEPITKKQYEDGFKKYDAWKASEDAKKAADKQAILDRIGLTVDELKTILG